MGGADLQGIHVDAGIDGFEQLSGSSVAEKIQSALKMHK